jgi:hypothetical protein
MMDSTVDHGGLQATTNAKIIGILHDGGRVPPIPGTGTVLGAALGDSLRLYGNGDICLLTYGGTIKAGDYLNSDTNGKGTAIASTGVKHIGAIALQGGVSGDIKLVQVTIMPSADGVGANANS